MLKVKTLDERIEESDDMTVTVAQQLEMSRAEVADLRQALVDKDLALMEQTEIAQAANRQAEARQAEIDMLRFNLREAMDSLVVRMAHAQAPVAASVNLESIEQYRLQMAAICTAAIGYWKEGDGILPEYDTLALRDVAKLHAKYLALHEAASQQHAQPDLTCVIHWLENGCDPLNAAKELRIYQKQMGLPDVAELPAKQHAQAAQADDSPFCPICGSTEARTGTCGSSDPRAFCNIAAPAQPIAGELPPLPDLPTHAVLYKQNGYRRAAVTPRAGEALVLIGTAKAAISTYGHQCRAAALEEAVAAALNAKPPRRAVKNIGISAHYLAIAAAIRALNKTEGA